MSNVNRIAALTALAGFLSAAAIGIAAAQMPGPRGPMHAPIDVAAVLDLDAEKASQVDAILRAAHEKMRAAMDEFGPPADAASRAELHQIMEAIRAEADQKLAAILTTDELARLHDAMQKQRAGHGAGSKRG